MIKRLLNLTGDKLHALPLLVLYLTDGCNSRCVTCDIWRSPRRNMLLALVEQAAAAFPELSVRHVLLSGGEAMQHPEWPTIADRFRAAGARVMLLTNGLLLRKQADAVADHIDEVIVSLDGGTAGTYQAIRGVDAFELVLDGIRAVRAAGIPVTTRTTVQRANYHELPRIVEAALGANANLISFLAVDVASSEAFGPRDLGGSTLHPAALTADDLAALDVILHTLERDYAPHFANGTIAEPPDKLRRILLDYFRAVAGMGSVVPPRCNAPHFSTVIEVDGTLRPCYFLPAYGRFKPGDRLNEAINVPLAQALRAAYRRGERAECARCVCPLYKSPRALATF